MLLAIDAGNRNVAVGFREGGEWQAIRHFGVSAERTADDYAMLLSSVAGIGGSATGGVSVDEAWISSVVPALTPRLIAAVFSAFGVDAQVLGPGVKTGMKIRTDNPAEVGGDLVCAALAAREIAYREGETAGAHLLAETVQSPGPRLDAEEKAASRARGAKPLIVVDFGAAVAICAVNAAGEFVGVSIAPGLETAALSLHSSTALIPEVRLEAPSRAIGRNTAESIRSGLVFGYAGLVERIVSLMKRELSPEAPESVLVFGTGDPEGRSILAAAGIQRYIPDLVLEGLSLVARKKAEG